MNTKPSRNDMLFLKSMFDILGSSEGQTLPEVKEDLRSEGIDIDKLTNRLLGRVKEFSMQAKMSRLDVARQGRMAAKEARPSFAQKFIGWTREEVLERIKVLASPGELNAAFSFRDLQNKGDEDLRSLLEDLELGKWKQDREA